MKMSRRRPRQHSRGSYRRKDGTLVTGTIVNKGVTYHDVKRKIGVNVPVKNRVASKPIKTVGVLGRQRMVEEEIMRDRPKWGGEKLLEYKFIDLDTGEIHKIISNTPTNAIQKLNDKLGRNVNYSFLGKKPIKDSDGDGVPDKFDCEPHNPEKQDNTNPYFSAKTVLQQLGGNKFIAMTGARDFVKDDKKQELYFRIPRAKKGINHVKIKLTSMDLYDMTFGRIRNMEYKPIKKVEGIYFDQLQDMFTENTGLYTTL